MASQTIHQYILQTGIWSPKSKKVQTPLQIPKYHAQCKFSEMACNKYVTLDGKQGPLAHHKNIQLVLIQDKHCKSDQNIWKWSGCHLKSRIWYITKKLAVSTLNSPTFLPWAWAEKKYHHFPPKTVKRDTPRGKNQRKTSKQWKERFNVTYSSSGESEVTPQEREKIRTTEKRVKMSKFW